MGLFQFPNFSGHRTKPDKLTFSERQRLRKAKELQDGEADGETPGALPLFRGHRTKPDKVTFSERLRLRKAAALSEEALAGAPFGHRTKTHLTFSERQRQRRKAKLSVTRERETLDQIDGPYSATWQDDSPLGSPRSSRYAELVEEEIVLEQLEDDAQVDGMEDGIEEQAKSFRIRVKMGPVAKRLLSGAFAGGISRTAVAPLETIRTHLMVGSTGKKGVVEMFHWIVATEGWKGLFRGNGINVLRVAPGKAIELLTYDSVKKALTPKDGSQPLVPLSSIAGSSAGIASCIATYPLELVKTRLTVQPGEYRGVLHAFWKIATQEGFPELYRGLVPSVIGVIPYAGCNYFAYDSLRTLYKRVSKKDKIGNVATLVIGSTAGAIASTATFPLEVARKQMQVGALSGRVVYKGTLDALQSIFKERGIAGLYRGLGPSCVKLMPAAGISFMCYEAFKQILIEEES